MKTFAMVYRLFAIFVFMVVLISPVVASDWHEEFDELCSKVQISDSLSVDELQSLIERCDKLLPLIQNSDEPKKKVYVFRVKKCRDMFEYSMQLKQ